MSDDIGNALQRAIVLHQQGRLVEAESLYRSVLAVAPDHGDALGMLGLLEAERGNHPEAVELLNRAIAVNPSDGNLFVSRGNSLLAMRRLDDALADYRAALKVDPDFDEAWNNTGVVLQNQKRLEPALDAFERALALKPENINAAINRAAVLHDLGRYQEAVDGFDNALSLDENDSEAFYGRANALRRLGEHEEALFSYDRALELRPTFVEAHTNRGNALRDLNRYTEALAGYDRALQIDPTFAEAHLNRSITLRDLKRADEALSSCDRALAFRPDYGEALHHRGIVLREMNRPQDAIASFDRVLRMNPDNADAHWNRSLCNLFLGHFKEGWREYEWRWGMDQSRHSKRHFTQPLWLGDRSLAGKTILLHAEQGLGDTLQFCRFAKSVAMQGAIVVVEVQPPLKSLLTGLDGVSQLFAQGEPLPPFDYHCPLMSLPLALGTELETIPHDIPYIKSDPERVERWKGRLASSAGPRIGLVWSSNDPARSMPLAALAEVAPSGRIQYVSLQKEINPEDRAVFEQRRDIVHFGADFCDTAAIVEHLDLVVTVDTSIAHLSAAMGKKVWILLPSGGDWIWLMDREDTPWYPTARLFRSPGVNGWSDVLRRLGDELRREFPPARS